MTRNFVGCVVPLEDCGFFKGRLELFDPLQPGTHPSWLEAHRFEIQAQNAGEAGRILQNQFAGEDPRPIEGAHRLAFFAPSGGAS